MKTIWELQIASKEQFLVQQNPSKSNNIYIVRALPVFWLWQNLTYLGAFLDSQMGDSQVFAAFYFKKVPYPSLPTHLTFQQ